jgi:hypothetical protein
MKYFTSLSNNLDKLYNCQLISFSPTKNVVHSPSIDSVYSYYLNFNNDIYVLNNWSYIQEQEIQNINNQNIFDCNK